MEFQWTDKLVKEFAIQYAERGCSTATPYSCKHSQKFFEDFKKSIQILEDDKFINSLIENLDRHKAIRNGQYKPKDYEILSFRHNFEEYILAHDGNYNRKNLFFPVSINHVPLKAEILSVKRLSDGEVFTIGDKVNYGTIEKIIMVWGSIEIQFTNGSGSTLASVEKVPKPLFKTEDGKEVFEGDRVWFVGNDFNIDFYDFNKMGGEDDLKSYPNLYKYFSTKEAAEEYVLMNKPCLSLKDISNIGKLTHFRIELDRKELKLLAKSKLCNQPK